MRQGLSLAICGKPILCRSRLLRHELADFAAQAEQRLQWISLAQYVSVTARVWYSLTFI